MGLHDRGPRRRGRGRPPRRRADRRGRTAGGDRGAARSRCAASGGHTPWRMWSCSRTRSWPGRRRDRLPGRRAHRPGRRPGPQPDPPDPGRALRIGAQRASGRCRWTTTTPTLRRARYAAELPAPRSTWCTSASGPTATPRPWSPATRCSTWTIARVAVTGRPYQGRRRMTLTYPGRLPQAGLLWIVSGEEKRDALEPPPRRATPRSRRAGWANEGVVLADRPPRRRPEP